MLTFRRLISTYSRAKYLHYKKFVLRGLLPVSLYTGCALYHNRIFASLHYLPSNYSRTPFIWPHRETNVHLFAQVSGCTCNYSLYHAFYIIFRSLELSYIIIHRLVILPYHYTLINPSIVYYSISIRKYHLLRILFLNKILWRIKSNKKQNFIFFFSISSSLSFSLQVVSLDLFTIYTRMLIPFR